MRTLLFSFLAILFSFQSFSQASASILLQQFIEKNKDNSSLVQFALIGEPRQLSKDVIALGGSVIYAKGDIVNARIPANKISEIIKSNALDYIEYDAFKGQILGQDVMLPNNNVLPLHIGATPFNFPIEGEDVIVGIIDSGIDAEHPDFLNEDGTSRILYIWEQQPNNNQPDRIPQPYGYGTIWTNADINAGISTHIDQPQHWGHGSMVAGIFTGNGSAVNDFKGVAPKADIIVVSTFFQNTNWLLTVADAVDFIFNKADEENKPVVINASVGSYLGSHDGLDAAGVLINNMVNEQAGRAFVCAVGNSGNIDYHLGYDITSDTSFTWHTYRTNLATGFSGVFVEAWADADNIQEAHFAWSAVTRTGLIEERGSTQYYQISDFAGNIKQDSIVNENNEKLANVQFWAGLEGNRYRIQMAIINPDSTNYHFSLKTTGSGRFDAWGGQWIGLNNMVMQSNVPTGFPGVENYKQPDRSMTTVSSFACAPDVITTGNIVNRSSYIDFNGILQTFPVTAGNIAATSSHGPTRDMRLKPDITATGDYNFGPVAPYIASLLSPSQLAPGGMHQYGGGSSAAGPVVAGVAALYLQICPAASITEIKEALYSSATGSNFTGILPNYTWGNGRVNAYGALLSSAIQVPVEINQNDVICGNQSVKLSAPSGFASYLWSNGSTEQEICVTTAGFYTVTVQDELGCFGFSEEILVEPLSVGELNISNFKLYPNPANNVLNLELSGVLKNTLNISIFDITGKLLLNEPNALIAGENFKSIDISLLSNGYYIVELSNNEQRVNLKFIK